MNPEEDSIPKQEKSPRRIRSKPRLQSKLKQSISESKMLQILDHTLDTSSNQVEEDELVCDSTMVALEMESPPEPQVCDRRGVVHTIRSMHKAKQ
ncbi:hypothetical protein THRCLA_21677 [Thraustotheca clavata]|uniref:Uncharacterized protein n=1 Tax=Thraustotheca clavata TaxID=74557 RepID=A0A1V9ZRC2_9STRA|nr:hypothetical protein THRCLA_21677 [Thraustotheca clavata]